MIEIKLSRKEWELYSSASQSDVDALNAAANQAVRDALAEMQKDGVSFSAALNSALRKAQAVFLQFAEVGAYDTDSLWHLEHQVIMQFSLGRREWS